MGVELVNRNAIKSITTRWIFEFSFRLVKRHPANGTNLETLTLTLNHVPLSLSTMRLSHSFSHLNDQVRVNPSISTHAHPWCKKACVFTLIIHMFVSMVGDRRSGHSLLGWAWRHTGRSLLRKSSWKRQYHMPQKKIGQMSFEHEVYIWMSFANYVITTTDETEFWPIMRNLHRRTTNWRLEGVELIIEITSKPIKNVT